MINFPGFKEIYEQDKLLNYQLETREYIESEYRNEDPNYILRKRKVKKNKKSHREKQEGVVLIPRNSDVYSYYKTEFRQNSMTEDEYGNILVPHVYQKKIRY